MKLRRHILLAEAPSGSNLRLMLRHNNKLIE